MPALAAAVNFSVCSSPVASIFGHNERPILGRERVKSGIAAAKARGQHHGRRSGSTTLKVAQVESKVLELVEQGKSYRAIAHSLGINKNTITRIVRDNRQT